MICFAHHKLIQFLVTLQLIISANHLKATELNVTDLKTTELNATEYTILDPENLITADQKQLLEKNQATMLAEQNTLISYGFYNVDASKLSTRLDWISAVEKAANDRVSSDQFHMLICIGIFSTQYTVDIFYKNQPSLEDVNDLNTCISSLTKDLASEPELDDLINHSADTIKRKLSYLNARPMLEQKKKQLARKTQAQEFINYMYNIVKIALWIIIPIIVILIICYMLSTIANRRPHYFPVSPNAPAKRLDAPHAATSISQTSK